MNKKLLVVDDDKSIRNVLQLSFETLGYKVSTADGGVRGEAMARQVHPDCIILDIMMPDKNGYVVCMDLKRDPATAKIPIVLLTAKNLKDDIYWGYECGADAYVTKPYEPRQLEALVDQLIAETAQGKRSVAWTGLPADGKVLEEAHARLDAGGDVFLAGLDFPQDAREAFLQKYGQARFRSLVHSVAWKVYELIRENSPAGLVGQRPDDSFVLLLNPSESQNIEALVGKAAAAVIEAQYDAKDRAARTLAYQEPTPSAPGVRREAPLLSLEWKPLEIAPP